MKPPFRTAAAILAAFMLPACCSFAAAEDWPLVRGDSSASGVAEQALPDSPVVLWKHTAAGSGFDASPVVAGGVVYIGDGDGTVHAVKLADGEVVWQKTFDDSGFLAAGGIEGDRLVLGDYNGLVRCLDRKSVV